MPVEAESGRARRVAAKRCAVREMAWPGPREVGEARLRNQTVAGEARQTVAAEERLRSQTVAGEAPDCSSPKSGRWPLHISALS